MIELLDGYVINVEDNGYSLGRQYVSKAGKKYTRVVAYLGSVERCLERLGRELEHNALSQGSTRLQEAVATICASHERLIEFLRSSLPEYHVVKEQ